jgi:hypothetical protein
MNSDIDTHNFHSFVYSSYSLPDIFTGRIARELWWMSQELSPASQHHHHHHHHHHHGSPCSHITRGMNNRSVGGRGSETFHPMDMINQVMEDEKAGFTFSVLSQ